MVLTFAFVNASVCFCCLINRGNVFTAFSFQLTQRNIKYKARAQKAPRRRQSSFFCKASKSHTQGQAALGSNSSVDQWYASQSHVGLGNIGVPTQHQMPMSIKREDTSFEWKFPFPCPQNTLQKLPTACTASLLDLGFAHEAAGTNPHFFPLFPITQHQSPFFQAAVRNKHQGCHKKDSAAQEP